MAIPFLNNINLSDNQLLNAKLQVTGTAPTAAAGQIYFNSTDNVAKYHNGTAWVDIPRQISVGGTSLADSQAIDLVAGANVGIAESSGTITISSSDQFTGTVTSVGASTAGDALDVAVTNAATTPDLAFTWAGAASQYIDGAGNLTTFPTIPTVPSNIVETIITTNGAFIDLTPATATDGNVTITADLSAGGTPSTTTYLRGDNAWEPISAIPGTYTFSVTGDTGTPEVINSGDTLYIAGGTYISTAVAATDEVTINHDNTSRTDTTSTDAPGYGGSFEAVTSVTTNDQGHVTAIDVSTVTIPASDNTDNYVDSVSFSTATGVLTLGRTGALADLTQDLDGRYLELAGGTMTGEINMGSDKITNLLDPTNDQDAATKAYVDNLVDGGLTFKDGFNATTGAIDGGGNLTSGGTRVALSVGDYYVVTTAGDFYGDSSYPLTVGDSVIAKEDAAAGASTVTDWVIIQGDEGVVDLTSGNGGTSTGNALTSNTTARGSVTVNSFAYGGTTNVGHVPSGGSGTTFLRGDGTWVTPTNTTPNDATITLDAGTNLTGGGDFTTDQSTNETITFNLATADGSNIGAGNVAAGTGISVAYLNGTATVTNTQTNSANTFSGLIGNGTLTSLPITSGTHGLGADSTSFMIQLVEVSSGETVYADVVRGASGLVTIAFAVAPASNSIRVLIQKIG